jgi:hypothetical protein
LFPITTFSSVKDYSIGNFHKSISKAKAQDFQTNSVNKKSPIFSQTKKKEKLKYSQGFKIFLKTFTKTMGLKVMNFEKTFTNNEVES